MASSFRTLADVMALADLNLGDEDPTELLQDARVLAALPAKESSNGQYHKYAREIGAPTVGFRTVNVGRELSKTTEEIVTAELKLMDASWSVDSTLIDDIGNGEANRQTSGHLRAAFKKFEQIIFYGTDATVGDTAGFSGLMQELTVAKGNVTLNGGGAGDELTSIYLIRALPNEIEAISQGEIEMGNITESMGLEAGQTDKWLNRYSMKIQAWLGLQVGTKYSAHRLANVATASAAPAGEKASDDAILDAVSVMPYEPTHIVMNRYALRDLRNSRTATSNTGVASRPTDVDGIPIISTTTLRTDEAIAS